MSARVELARAETLANELMIALFPVCHRIEIAGSIRRRRPDCKDIELVVVPTVERHLDMFGHEYARTNNLDVFLERALEDGHLAHRLDKNGHRAFGERYKRLVYKGVGLDLFSVLPPAQFGMIYLIRTGSADFSARLMTQRRFGGGMPDGWHVKDGALHNDRGEIVPTPEEVDVFAALGLDYVEPEMRR